MKKTYMLFLFSSAILLLSSNTLCTNEISYAEEFETESSEIISNSDEIPNTEEFETESSETISNSDEIPNTEEFETESSETINDIDKLNQEILSTVYDQMEADYDLSALTEDSKNKIAIKLINQEIERYTARASLSRSGYNLNSLTSKEKELTVQNPFQAALVKKYGNIAMEQTQRSWHDGFQDNGDGNAFQHTYWNLLLTNRIGSYYAELWTTAHEYGFNNASSRMDLANNAAGRNTYSDAVNFYKGLFKRHPTDKDLAEWAVRMNFNRRSYKLSNSGGLISTTGSTYKGYL